MDSVQGMFESDAGARGIASSPLHDNAVNDGTNHVRLGFPSAPESPVTVCAKTAPGNVMVADDEPDASDTTEVTVLNKTTPPVPGRDQTWRRQCSICHKVFKPSKHLYDHTVTHETVQWRCHLRNCSSSFHTQQELDQHLWKIHPYNRYIQDIIWKDCPLDGCNFKYSQWQVKNFHEHLRYHGAEMIFKGDKVAIYDAEGSAMGELEMGEDQDNTGHERSTGMTNTAVRKKSSMAQSTLDETDQNARFTEDPAVSVAHDNSASLQTSRVQYDPATNGNVSGIEVTSLPCPVVSCRRHRKPYACDSLVLAKIKYHIRKYHPTLAPHFRCDLCDYTSHIGPEFARHMTIVHKTQPNGRDQGNASDDVEFLGEHVICALENNKDDDCGSISLYELYEPDPQFCDDEGMVVEGDVVQADDAFPSVGDAVPRTVLKSTLGQTPRHTNRSLPPFPMRVEDFDLHKKGLRINGDGRVKGGVGYSLPFGASQRTTNIPPAIVGSVQQTHRFSSRSSPNGFEKRTYQYRYPDEQRSTDAVPNVLPGGLPRSISNPPSLVSSSQQTDLQGLRRSTYGTWNVASQYHPMDPRRQGSGDETTQTARQDVPLSEVPQSLSGFVPQISLDYVFDRSPRFRTTDGERGMLDTPSRQPAFAVQPHFKVSRAPPMHLLPTQHVELRAPDYQVVIAEMNNHKAFRETGNIEERPWTSTLEN